MPDSEFSLLPTNVRPLRYRITLWPDLDSFTFRGQEQVDIEVTEPTSRIVLNAVELGVQSASRIQADGGVTTADSINLDESAETLTLEFASPLPKGQATLELQFTGTLNDRLQGFYRSRYTPPGGPERFLATTQFESTDARRAFPCWDEPALKATFQVTLVIPDHLTAICNTPVGSEQVDAPGHKRVTFMETPVMSTYLLAFLVGEFESVEATAPGGTLVRVWTTPGKAEQGRFALETAVRLLGYFNDYFGIPYPLPKLDHIAAPDFAAGAMENWGAITYRETALLVDPQNSAAGTRQRVAEVVAHEMAHMWFGDLVTMEWWNDLWLNESFASWMGTKAVDHLFPEWEMWTQFIIEDLVPGLSLDGLRNSHPIEQPVRDPAEVSQLFDAISYSKGASILRMLEQFLGEETFRAGLHSYLDAHKYGNARGADLWTALQEASGQPVTSLMESWTLQMGYPVLETAVEREGEQLRLHLSQQRFLYDADAAQSPDPALWQVPVSVTGEGASSADRLLLDQRESSLLLESARPAVDDSAWVKVNAAQTGFYRVNYQPREWDRFIPAIESHDMPAADRLGLENDAYALARAGLLPATQFLTLAQAYKNETEYSLWSDLAGNLRQLGNLLTAEPFLPQFHALVRELLTPVVQRVGWDAGAGEGHLQSLLRSTVLGGLGFFGDIDTLTEAQRRFTAALDQPSSLAPDLRAVVYALSAQVGDAPTHQRLRDMANQTTLQEERVRLHMAMGRFQQPELLRSTLELALSEEIRSQDTISLISAVAGNRIGKALAWQFLKDNWPEFDRRYGSGGFGIMRLVSITGAFTTTQEQEDVRSFFEAHPVPAATRTIQQSLERIGLNVRWLDRNRADLAAWFGSQ